MRVYQNRVVLIHRGTVPKIDDLHEMHVCLFFCPKLSMPPIYALARCTITVRSSVFPTLEMVLLYIQGSCSQLVAMFVRQLVWLQPDSVSCMYGKRDLSSSNTR